MALGPIASLLAAGGFFVVDLSFLTANMTKVLQGGYIPLLLAAAVYTVMLIWHRGVLAAARTLGETTVPVEDFLEKIRRESVPRVPGTAVFLTRSLQGTPPVMKWQVKRNGSLHANVLALTIAIVNEPRVSNAERLVMRELSPGFWCGVASYGFMERPNIPQLLQHVEAQKSGLNFDEATYYLGHETVVRREANDRLPSWQRNLFALMVRNGMHVTDYYYLPSDQVVEISRRVPV